MDFFPKQPGLTKPSFATALTLVGCQMVVGAGFLILGSIFGHQGTGVNSAAGFLGAMLFGQWAEMKVPDALARRKYQVTLSGWVTVIQGIFAAAWAGLFLNPAEEGFGSGLSNKALGIIIPVVLIFCFLMTWAGMAAGRSLAKKQRARMPKP